MRALYKIDKEILEELAFLEQSDETGEDKESIQLRLDSLAMERDAKISNVVAYFHNLRAEQEACEAEAKRLRERAAVLDRRLEGFRWYIGAALRGEKWTNGVHSVGYRKSESVEVVNEEAIPSVYMREKISYEPDKKQIKDDLKNGATIPGVSLVEKTSVQIK